MHSILLFIILTTSLFARENVSVIDIENGNNLSTSLDSVGIRNILGAIYVPGNEFVDADIAVLNYYQKVEEEWGLGLTVNYVNLEHYFIAGKQYGISPYLVYNLRKSPKIIIPQIFVGIQQNNRTWKSEYYDTSGILRNYGAYLGGMAYINIKWDMGLGFGGVYTSTYRVGLDNSGEGYIYDIEYKFFPAFTFCIFNLKFPWQ